MDPTSRGSLSVAAGRDTKRVTRLVLFAGVVLAFLSVSSFTLAQSGVWVLWSPNRPGAKWTRQAAYDSRADCLRGAETHLRNLHPKAKVQEMSSGRTATILDGDNAWFVLAECWPINATPDYIESQR